MIIICRVVFFVSLVNYTSSQYITVGSSSSRRVGKSTCDNSSKSALVEHFFNIIFNEFHSAPPVCVCVQMCVDQPTYCYPNGCLRKADLNKKAEVQLPVTRVSEHTKPIFLLDERKDFMRDLLNKNDVDENKPAPELGVNKQANVMPINLRPDPFKDRYKMLFKYKKMPKVELKYNLGEQVKNMKSDVLNKDNVDILKTRWPTYKINSNRLSQPRINSENQENDNLKFFMNMYSQKEISNYPPKYFKRELINVTNNNTEVLDTNVGFVEGKEFENNSYPYSLEKIIDSLIESSFKRNETSNSILLNNTTVINISTTEQYLGTTESVTAQEVATETAVAEQTPNNDTSNIISMNHTNENVDKNKYTETDVSNSKNNVSEMIASLSKKIDLQNNTSLEMMRRMIGNHEFDSISDRSVVQSTLKGNIETVTRDNTRIPGDYRIKTIKKGRQRLIRRFQNSKNN